MRPLPDPDLSLRDASDFIFDCPLARRALTHPDPPYIGVFLRELVQEIYRLTLSCHLPEFTDHGLSHLCSLVDRLSRWTVSPSSARSGRVIDQPQFTPETATVLLLATLLHDVGMLSQRPEDLPESEQLTGTRSTQSLSEWVRATHVTRLEQLVSRLFRTSEYTEILEHPIFLRSIKVAQAHEKWPWEWNQFSFSSVDEGLAAMLAVSDLLDEDSLRCDSKTLLRHRFGSALNVAHWIRHGLTQGRVLVDEGQIAVQLARPDNTDVQINTVFTALRNHYKLVLLYAEQLDQVSANLVSVSFTPSSGIPSLLASGIHDWSELSEFATQGALVYHLLSSFMPWALIDARRIPDSDVQRLLQIGLVPIDLTRFYEIRGTVPPHTTAEQCFQALL